MPISGKTITAKLSQIFLKTLESLKGYPIFQSSMQLPLLPLSLMKKYRAPSSKTAYTTCTKPTTETRPKGTETKLH